ncbi:MAG: flagellin [Planctomycetota bacterium]
MGLRINTNAPSLTALRMLQSSDKSLSNSLQRLSTGLRINKASDDPSGLVISEQLRAQINSLQQASRNAQNASNLVNTGEAALAEVNALLIQMRESAIFALNTGGASVEQINAEQDSIDNAIAAIDRIASTTRFATRHLINGESGFNIRSAATAIGDLNPISVAWDPRSSDTSFSLIITQNSSQATLSAVGGTGVVASGGPVTLRMTGGRGTEDITIPSGGTLTAFQDSLNLLRGNTGVYASAGMLYSEEFGSREMIRLEQVSGTGTFTGAGGAITAVGEFTDDSGVDVGATINGVAVNAQGNTIRAVSNIFSGSINMEPGHTVGNYSFTIRRSGLTFQLSNQGGASDQAVIGLPSLYTNNLGRHTVTTAGVTSFGFLSTLGAGGANDLLTDPSNALKILDVAIDQVSDVRAFLGAFVNDNVDPAIRELAVHMENLSASESTIRDLDFASETAELTKNQILFQSGISVIAQTNAIPQAVIQLLQ